MQKVVFAVDSANFGQSLAQILRADAVKYCDTIYIKAAENKFVISAGQGNRQVGYACSIERTVPAVIVDDLQGTFCLQRKTATMFERVAKLSDVAAAKSAQEHAKRRAEAAAVTATDKEFARLTTLLAHVRAAKTKARLVKASNRLEAALNSQYTKVVYDASDGCARFVLGDKFKLKLTSSRQTNITPNVAVNDAAAPLTLKIAQNELLGLLNGTLYAANISDWSESIFSCVNLQTTPQGLLAQSINRCILAKTLTAKFTCDGELNCNIPAVVMKFVEDLLRAETANRDVTIKFYPPAKNFPTAEIAFDDWRIRTTCPIESFPDTNKLFPPNVFVHAHIDSKIFLAALNFVAPLARTYDGYVELCFEGEQITLKATADEIGSASMSVAALIHGVENCSARVAVNINYLLDAITHADVADVTFELAEKFFIVRGNNTTAVIARLKCDG